MSRRKREHGLALIVVVGVLGVLSVLAVAFVTMAQLERKASAQRVNAARAFFLARSGIEDALARLGMGQDPVYKGEDWNANGALDSGVETASQVYKPGALDTDACPVRYALRPSFFVRDPANLPRLQPVDGRQLGYSGALSGDSGARSNQYALKAGGTGGNSGFYVNGGDPSASKTPGAPPAVPVNYNDVLKRILGTLCDAVDREPDGVTPHGTLSVADGWALIDQRPSAGWQNFDQIRDLALGGNQAKLDALKSYITLHAWVDTRVIAPNATVAMEPPPSLGGPLSGTGLFHSWGEIKLAHLHPDFERIPRTAGSPIVGRAPVDLSWARSKRPALVALIAGLRGLFLDETLANAIGGGTSGEDLLGGLREAGIANTWIATDDCHIAVNAIQTYAGPLDTWQKWNAFCDTISFPDVDPNWISTDPPSMLNIPPPNPPVPNPASHRPLWIADLKQAKKNLLKANFNPNTDANKFNPNASQWKSLDKTDLLDYSTELILAPLSPQGSGEVSSVGRVLDGAGRLLAMRTLSITLAQPQVLRLTTQKDFTNDENDVPRKPGDANFLSLSQGIAPTWGHTRANLSPPGGFQGLGLQSYPEPITAPPADWDGCLQLATIETRDNDVYSLPSPASPLGMRLLAHFDDSFDLGLMQVTPGVAPWATKTCQPDGPLGSGLVSRSDMSLTNSIWDGTRPSTLYPDGSFSEKDRCPAWFDHGVSQGYHEVLSFWVKDAFSISSTTFSKGRQWVHRTNYTAKSQAPHSADQFWFLGYVRAKSPVPLGGVTTGFWTGITNFFEMNHAGDSDTRDHDVPIFFQAQGGGSQAAPSDILMHRWVLITDAWDLQGGASGDNRDNGKLLLDDGANAGGNGAYTADPYGDIVWQGIWDWVKVVSNSNGDCNGNVADSNSANATDLTDDDLDGHHLLCLGRHGKFNEFGIAGLLGNGADATFDEVALYDFGGGFATDIAGDFPNQFQSLRLDSRYSTWGSTNAFLLAKTRWQEGRYYTEAGYRAPGAPALVPSPTQSGEAGSWISALLGLPSGAVLQQVFWTWYRPSATPSLTTSGQGFDFSNDYAEVELLSPDGSGYLWKDSSGVPDPLQSRSTRAPHWTNQLQCWQPGRALPGPFRARVIFRRGTGASDTAPADNVSVPIGTPLLDSPVFDDLTFVYTPGPGLPLIGWQEGE